MKHTKNLGLPIFDNPETDLFKITEWNEANENIDNTYGELKNWSDNLPLVNADAEIVEARCGEKTLGDKVRKIGTQMETKANKTEVKDITINIKEYEHLVVNGDWKPALEKALETYNKIFFPRGEYTLSNTYLKSDVVIYGDGRNTIFNKKDSVLFSVIGSVEDELLFHSNMPDFSNVVPVNNSNLKENDFIYLRGVKDALNVSDSGESWCLGFGTSSTDTLVFGEFLEVESATSNNITTKNTTIFPLYTQNKNVSDTSSSQKQNSTCQKVNFIKNVTIKDITIKGHHSPVINVDYGYNVVIENVINIADGYVDGMCGIVTFKRSLECIAKNCEFKINHTITPSQHYYVNVFRITSSQDCIFDGCKAYNTTQAFDVSYLTYAIPSINATIRNCFSKNAQQTGMTTHQGTYIAIMESNTVVGCKQGIYCRTKNSIISNNKIINNFVDMSTSYGIGIGESNTINCIISNNTITNAKTGIYITDGINDNSYYKYAGLLIEGNTISNFITGIHINKMTPYDTSPMFIDIINNKLYSTNVSDSNLRGIFIGKGSDTIKIDGNTISLRIADNLTYGVYLDYDVNNCVITNNNIRKCRQGLYHRRVQSFTKVYINETNNKFYECETNDNLTTPSVSRINNNNISYALFNYVSSTSNVPTSSCLFLYSDGTLRYRDKDGTLKTIATI